jgi:hypothetical protein
MASISDHDRDRVVRELTKHCGDGRLTLDELEERIGEAYAATTSNELQHALRELPSFRPEPAEPAAAAAAPSPRVRPAPAPRCGAGLVGGPPPVLIALIAILFVTAHVFWAVLLLVITMVKRGHRRGAYVRA